MPSSTDLRVAAARLHRQAGTLGSLLTSVELGPDAWSGRAADRFRAELERRRSDVATAVAQLNRIADTLIVEAAVADAAARAAVPG